MACGSRSLLRSQQIARAMASAEHSRTLSAKAGDPSRLAWLDGARGVATLLMIAIGAATLPFSPYEKAGLGAIAAYASPFAAPTFFLVAGLLLRNSLKAPWPTFLLHKVTPLIWRYILWGAAGTLGALWLSALLRPGYLVHSFARTLIDPPAMLLVLCALPLCFIVLRALRAMPLALLAPLAITLEILTPMHGGPIVATFCRLFVYLYFGYVFATEVKTLTRFVASHRILAIQGLVIWAILNGLAVFVPIPFAHGATLAQLPFASLGLGLFGAAAMIVLARLTETGAETISARHIGERALGVYLSGFLLIEALRGASVRFASGFAPGAGLLIAGGVILVAAIVGFFLRSRANAPLAPASAEFAGGKARLEIASRASSQ